MKSLLKYAAFALLAGILLYGLDALAADTGKGAFQTAANLMKSTFQNVRMIVYLLGAFGLIGIAVAAIMGKINFKWLAVLAIGLAIVAGADAIVSYAIQDTKADHKDNSGYGYENFEPK